MTNFDAIIVGGGPAGSTAAWHLTLAGLHVAVIDKQSFPRDKVCAGWITPNVLTTLEIDPEEYASGRTIQAITGFRTGQIMGRHTDTIYDNPVSYGIRRREFDHYLLQRSEATKITGQPVKTIRRIGRSFIINESFQTPLLIGAGGHFCPVARYLGAKIGSGERVVAAKEIEFEMSPHQQQLCAVVPERPELYFCEDLKGYAWVFRKDGFLNIGLGREDNHKLSEHIDQFIQFLTDTERVPFELPSSLHGHAYLLYGHGTRNAIGDGVILIGDSLGLAYPESGEGILPAIESASLAANVILAANNDYRKDKLLCYPEKLEARFGKASSASAWKKWLIPAAGRKYISEKLVTNPWFAHHMVMDRWFLHSNRPALHAQNRHQ
ncbi:MAG: NAD(P)/FAD-dependent oxidoreductase [Gammaproteobacteria bacterium]|nr:NAD(P)/FAD-dependent oxidoreductase [Gammaproteobacteria bacterium]